MEEQEGCHENKNPATFHLSVATVGAASRLLSHHPVSENNPHSCKVGEQTRFMGESQKPSLMKLNCVSLHKSLNTT
jgi:hypothetical protein